MKRKHIDKINELINVSLAYFAVGVLTMALIGFVIIGAYMLFKNPMYLYIVIICTSGYIVFVGIGFTICKVLDYININ